MTKDECKWLGTVSNNGFGTASDILSNYADKVLLFIPIHKILECVSMDVPWIDAYFDVRTRGWRH